MTQMIKSEQDAYDRYRELLLKRDQAEKEAAQILVRYTREFGELLAEVFEAKIDCIRLKKEISWCQAQLNRGEKVDMDEMKKAIDRTMAMYYKELQEMIDRAKEAKEMKRIPAGKAQEVKRIYRKLAKRLHPDINPKTREIPQLEKLWFRISAAYHSNDLEGLRELEVLTAEALKKAGIGDMEIEIPDIDERIERLEKEISDIVLSEPYIFREMLDDPEEAAEKAEGLKKEKKEYEQYKAQLSDTLSEMLRSQGGHMVWRMS